MNYKFFLLNLILAISFLFNSAFAENQVKLINETAQEIQLQVNIDDYQLTTVDINGEKWSRLTIPDGSVLMEAGSPELPKWAVSVQIPDFSSWRAEIVSSEYIELQNIKIAPSKGNLTRNINPSDIPFTFGPAYSQNEFYPESLTKLGDPYILRDFRGMAVQLQAFQYNPVQQILRVYKSFTIKLYQTNDEIINPMIRSGEARRASSEFEQIYRRQFINYPEGKYNAVAEEGEMLIISHPSFMEVLAPLVSWKIQRGMPTTMVDVTTIGNSSAIKSFIANAYSHSNLTYVLLVGDHAYVPSSSTSAGVSDNNYAYITGSDHYPEVFIGRFSAETVAHAQTMVERVLDYERNPLLSSHFEHSLALGSSQGPGDDGEMDYQHLRNMQVDLLGFTYTSKSEFFDGSQGGLDVSGDPTAAAVAAQLNVGAGVILYTGHGSDISFSSSNFSNSHVNALTNIGKLPFIWAVACVNGNFANQTCFAEAWTRATSNNKPSGAIATMMSTINQSWNPPMCAQDEMVDILTESYTNNIKRSFGGISMNGCMLMNDEYGSAGYEMTDTWTCFGDPSLMVRTKTPQTLSITHLPTTFIGMNSFQVNSLNNGAFVALTSGNQILGTGHILNGSAIISHPILNNVGTITITVTGFNFVPYIATIDIIPNEGPFVTLNSYQVNDQNGNTNFEADFNETIQLDLSLLNVGIEKAYNVTGTLSSQDPFVTILSNTYAFGDIDSAAGINPNGVFTIQISESIADQHSIPFTLTLVDDSANTWTSAFSISVNAPELELSLISVDEMIPANMNGRLDAGEHFKLTLKASNIGHAPIDQAIVELISASAFLTLTNSSYTTSIINGGEDSLFIFEGTIANNTPIKEKIEFESSFSYGSYSTEMIIEKEVGAIVEDWESADFTAYTWTTSGNQPWQILSTGSYEGQYTAKSGVIGNSQSSIMQLQIQVLEAGEISFYKKVSCEAASGTSFWDYLEFQINGVSKGKWAGEIGWSKESFQLAAGSYTLKWIYSKDSYYVGGSDCAWIDFIEFPLIETNFAPFFTTQADTLHIATNQNYSFTLEAFDQNQSDVLLFTADTLLPGFEITNLSNISASFSGTAGDDLIGYHPVTIFVSDGIAAPSAINLILHIYNAIGIETENDSQLKTYPNPASEILNIEFPNSGAGLVRIFSMQGKLLLTSGLKEGYSQLDLKLLPNGIYLLEVEHTSRIHHKKIIIRK